ncbi:predicted protein [Nematostella vectensis]|uniref:Calpain-6 n=1 Tax=Nematostella vectensis TaxID=45351 RepID=A7SN59_NEMVE|nr:calpain-5 [Nematostella vectensis]EDO34860.1 predicted protein [Nematostella vectensis]|eukprot:XP_001626960.1 predicted protein [Nematostella vectensis]
MVRLHYFANQRYSKLKAECEKNEQLFVDSVFKPETSSLYYSRSCPPEPVEWKRPSEICHPAVPHLFVDGADSHDVTQGKLGNCWFVAACSSLALRPFLLYKVIPDKDKQEWDPKKPENYQGIFRFRFYRQGEWTEVVVDDLLPTVNGKLVYIHSKEKNEFWSALIEKAYAKLAGTYEALAAGSTADALVDFTGGVAEAISLSNGGYAEDQEKRLQLFKTLERGHKEKSLMSASIKINNRNEMEQRLDTGLIKGHAYGVTMVKKVTVGEGLLSLFNKKHFYMIRLRNPWGEKEWNGRWSDESEEWKKLKPGDRKKMGIVFENDGEFWMEFDDFCREFTDCTLCHVINKAMIHKVFKQWHIYKHNYNWTQGQNAGGCVQNQDTFLKNPQYAFSITDNEGEDAMVSLMQEDRRKDKSKGVGNLTIGFYIMKVEENRKYRVHSMFPKAGDSIFINAREVMNRFFLAAGRYLVVPSTYEPHTPGHFMMRIFTRKRSNAMFLDQDHSVGSKIWCCLPRCRAPQCVVSVYVTSAAGLQKTGKMSLTCDPYALIICEGRKIKTPIKYDTLIPSWDAGALFYVRQPQKSQIVVQIWDSNWILDSFMGQVKIPVNITNSKTQASYNLKGRRREHDLQKPGTVTVQINAYHDLFGI